MEEIREYMKTINENLKEIRKENQEFKEELITLRQENNLLKDEVSKLRSRVEQLEFIEERFEHEDRMKRKNNVVISGLKIDSSRNEIMCEDVKRFLEEQDNLETTQQEQGTRARKIQNEWRLATWNVRGVSGKEVELSGEFDKARLNILGIVETKKKGKGECILEGGHLMLYSGVPMEKRAEAGVGCIINKNWIKHVQNIDYVNERLMKVEFNFNKEIKSKS
nr:unnamed protein product [Callosobruchus chinensis]